MREIPRERQNDDNIYPQGIEGGQLLLQGLDLTRRIVGCQDLERVRVECEDQR